VAPTTVLWQLLQQFELIACSRAASSCRGFWICSGVILATFSPQALCAQVLTAAGRPDLPWLN
jgi:hypothetical protein